MPRHSEDPIGTLIEALRQAGIIPADGDAPDTLARPCRLADDVDDPDEIIARSRAPEAPTGS